MSNRVLSIILLTGILLSACGGQAPVTEASTTEPTATTVPPATNTPLPTDTPTPEGTFTPSPTATQYVPDNAADCTNHATFVNDVTIPDNSTVTAGETFTKTWRVQNSGTCIWWSGYTLSHYSDESMSAPDSVPLPVTNPGETADISIALVAPTTAGTHRGYFVIKNPDGLIMKVDNDSRLWVIINVVAAPTGAATATTAATSGATIGAGTPSATPVAGSGTSSGTANCAFTTDAAATSAMVAALTAYRAQSNLPPLPVNAQLSEAAQRQANDMACNNLFGHTGSDGSTPATRVADSGYVATDVTENVYGSYPPLDGQGVISWWANDKTDIRHNENLLTTKYTEIGVGYSFFNNYGYYVIVFATNK